MRLKLSLVALLVIVLILFVWLSDGAGAVEVRNFLRQLLRALF